MKPFQALLQSVVAPMAILLTLSAAFAQDAPARPEVGQKTDDANPSNPITPPGDVIAPEITGIWLMGEQGSFGRCKIRRVEGENYRFYEVITTGPGSTPDSTPLYGVRFQWMPETRQFQGTWSKLGNIKGTATCVLRLDGDGKLSFVATLDEEARAAWDSIKSTLSPLEQTRVEESLNMKWTRERSLREGKIHQAFDFSPATNPSTVSANSENQKSEPVAPDDNLNAQTKALKSLDNGIKGRMGGTPSPAGNAGPRRMEGMSVLVVETDDGFAGYSMPLGKWDRVIVGPPKDGSPRLKRATVGLDLATVVIDDQLFGFSSMSARWGKLKIPAEEVGKVRPMVGRMISVDIGNQMFVFSPTTSEWTTPQNEPQSPTESALTNAATIDSLHVQSAEQKLQAGLSNPESRQLTEQIAMLDFQAAKLANQIRTMNQSLQDGQSIEPKVVESRKQELKTTLNNTFDLKHQLEQLRVKELQLRLSRLEQQIGRRQSQRTQIIERRARELIEGDETQWNSDLDASTHRNNSPTEPTSELVTPDAKSTTPQTAQVAFKTIPEIDGAIDSDGTRHSLPCQIKFYRSNKPDSPTVHRLELQGSSPEFGRASLTLILEIHSVQAASENFLASNPIPIQITREDLDQAVANNRVTKVFYLPHTKYQELAATTVEAVVSTKLDPGIDVIVEARRQGTVLAVLRFMSINSYQSNAARRGQQNTSDSNTVNVQKSPFLKRPSTENPEGETRNSTPEAGEPDSDNLAPFQSSFPSYRRLAMGLEEARTELDAASTDFPRIQKFRKTHVVTQVEFDNAQRRLDTAQRKYQILQDDLAAVMSDLATHLKFATNELNGATELFQIINAQYGAGQAGTDKKSLTEAELRMKQAQLAVERLKARYELYKKVLHKQIDVQKLGILPIPNHENHDERLIASMLGIQLVPLPESERFKLGANSKYRKGMTVMDVAPESLADKSGIRKGDILVGLGKWETVSVDNVRWILNRIDNEKPNADGKIQIRFVVVRNSEEKDGFIPFTPHPVILDFDEGPKPLIEGTQKE